MFTKAEIVCGVSGFSIILGMLHLAPLTDSFMSVILIVLGVVGLAISTNLHESD